MKLVKGGMILMICICESVRTCVQRGHPCDLGHMSGRVKVKGLTRIQSRE